MPYGCDVLASSDCTVVLRVVPEQPDCEPFYTSAAFAVGLLAGDGENAITARLGDESFNVVAADDFDPRPFVVSVDVSVEERGSVRHARPPSARYTVRVTSPAWIAHLTEGAQYDSYAYGGEGAPVLEAELWEKEERLPVHAFARGDRVRIRTEIGMGPGVLVGRGVVEEARTCPRPPEEWKGGTLALRVALDHGPTAWAFAEALRPAPDDTYERAARAPAAFFAELLARPPLERARGLHFLALRSGGTTLVAAENGLQVGIAGASPWLAGLWRRLGTADVAEIAGALLDGWTMDPATTTRKFGRAVAGVELAAGDVVEPYHFEVACPLELTLGALTLVVAERRASLAPHAATLRPALRAVASLALQWRPEPFVGYPLAACDGEPPALPSWTWRGYPHEYENAAHRGLPGGAFVYPGIEDLYRP